MDTGALSGVRTDFGSAGFSGGGVKAILEPGTATVLGMGVLGMGLLGMTGRRQPPSLLPTGENQPKAGNALGFVWFSLMRRLTPRPCQHYHEYRR